MEHTAKGLPRVYVVETPGRKEGSVGPTEAEVPFPEITDGRGSHLPLAGPAAARRPRKQERLHGDA